MDSTACTLPATPKQIAYARSLALRNQTLLPWEVQQDLRSLDPGHFPAIAQVAPVIGVRSPSESFEVGMDVVIEGIGFVYFDDKPITDWEGHLPRLLLFFAVDRGVITREDFHRAFWLGNPSERRIGEIAALRAMLRDVPDGK